MFHIEERRVSDCENLKGDLVNVTAVNQIKVDEITFEPRPCVFTKALAKNIEKFSNFHVREDDVWVVSFPKCGTTWAQEMCWLILNNFDFDKAKEIDIGKRGPFLEFSTLCGLPNFDSVENCDKLKSPRFLKSHLPLPALPRELWTKHPKIVYVVRDPRDAAISDYHHFCKWSESETTKEEFLDLMIKDEVTYGPFWDHVSEFWKIRNQSNVLFLTYEDMKLNLEAIIRKACNFFNKTITEDQMPKMLEHLSFDSMKDNKATQHDFQRSLLGKELKDKSFRFVRRGIIGAYKDEFPSKYIKIYKDWMQKNLERTDFDFYKKYL